MRARWLLLVPVLMIGVSCCAATQTRVGQIGNSFPQAPTAAPPPLPATQLVITSQPPASTVHDVSFGLTVTVRDATNATVTTGTGNNASVTVAIGTNTGVIAPGMLSGTTTVAASSGVAVLTGLSINQVGSNYTVTVSSSGLTGATSNTFNIVAGTATTLGFTQQPGSSNTNVAFVTQPKIAVQDSASNTVTTSSAAITLAIGSGTGVLTCTTNPVTASSGVATFAGCKIDTAGTKTLSATASGLTSATSANFSVTATTPDNLIHASNFVYQGAFRLPSGLARRLTGTMAMAYHAANNSLFIGSSLDFVEISIPTLSTATDYTLLNSATTLQNLTSQAGRSGCYSGSGDCGLTLVLAGAMVNGAKLYYTSVGAYDTGSSPCPGLCWNKPAFFVNKSDLTTGGGGGFSPTGFNSTSGSCGGNGARCAGGWVVPVPSGWQSQLGGDTLMGLSGGAGGYVSIVSTSSRGPAVASFTLTNWTNATTSFSVTPLVVYNADAEWTSGGPTQYGRLGGATGAVFPTNFDSLLFLGADETPGPDTRALLCYGPGVGGSYPPNPLVDGAKGTGTNATTNGTGLIVTTPSAGCQSATHVQLVTQTLPNYYANGNGGSAPGVAEIASNNGSLTACQYTVYVAFPSSLTSQSYRLGDLNCFDPNGSAKGYHGYPGRLRVWAYKASDLAKVKAGTLAANAIQDYDSWTPTLTLGPNDGEQGFLGAAYDPTNQLVYAMLSHTTDANTDRGPDIVVFKVQ